LSVRNHPSSQYHSLANPLYMVLALVSIVGCSAYPQSAPAVTETITSIAAPIVSPTVTSVGFPTATPIPQPIQIGSLGSGVISDVFRSPDGRLIAIGIGNVVHWYDSKTFEEIGSLPLNVRGAEAIRFSADGSFAGVEGDLTAQVVDLGNQKIVATISEHESFISDLSFTPDNQYVTYRTISIRGFGDLIGLWNIRTDEMEHYFDVLHPDQYHMISGPVVSPDGKLVAAGSDKQVYIWDLTSGQRKFLLEWHTDNVTNVAFSPDGKWLAAGGLDRTVRLWDTSTGKRVQLISGMAYEVSSVEFSSDGKQLKIYAGGRLSYIWDFNAGNLLDLTDTQPATPDPFAVKMHHEGFSQNWFPESSGEVLFSPDGHSLALGSEPILVWDLAKRIVSTSLENPRSTFMTNMQYSPDGRWLATCDDFSNLLVWDTLSSELHKTRGGLRAFAFSADSSTLALAGRTVIEVWNIESDTLRSTIKLSQGSQRVNHLAFSFNNNQIHAVLDLNDKQVTQTWDVVTGELLDQFELPERNWMAFSATDMRWPYFARNNATDTQSWIEIWNLETKQIVSSLQTPRAETEPLQFSPDGKLIMAISNGDLYAWNTLAGELVFTIQTIAHLPGIAISTDNQILAIEQLGKVELWDISQVVKDVINP
jgi:WD40 repeat protein